MVDSHDSVRDLSFVSKIVRELEAEHKVALCTVLATRGSMPRGAGARMAAFEDGSFAGTIGGGRIERMALDVALAVARGEGEPFLTWLTQKATGMACGGDGLVACDLLTQADLPALRRTKELVGSNTAGLLVEEWGEEGHHMEALGLEELPPDDPRISLETPLWDEGGRAYAEPLGGDPVAYVFGAGHVSHALVPVLAGTGFRVAVFDDRAELALPERFPQAEEVLLGDFRELEGQVSITRRDYVVVATHGHAADIDVLELVSKHEPSYVGCLGSARKAAYARDVLEERGVSRAWADAIHMPIGDDILAVTPGEIAISIAAEMIRHRAMRRPSRPHER